MNKKSEWLMFVTSVYQNTEPRFGLVKVNAGNLPINVQE